MKGADDYGVRLSMNLKKMRETSPLGGGAERMGNHTQSASVGTHLTTSPLEMEPRTHIGASDEEGLSSDSEDVHFHDAVNGRATQCSRSRSLTLPPSAPLLRKSPQKPELAGNPPSSAPNSSPTRMTSDPIQISQTHKNRLSNSGYAPLPLTDGALAEYAALSSTPLSNPNIHI